MSVSQMVRLSKKLIGLKIMILNEGFKEICLYSKNTCRVNIVPKTSEKYHISEKALKIRNAREEYKYSLSLLK